MSGDLDVAIIALIISVVAFVVTVSQFLAQLFATAEGRVKCSPNVMGSWGKLTKVKRHWTKFRFETTFVSPELLLGDLSMLSLTDPDSGYDKLGLSKSFTRTATSLISKDESYPLEEKWAMGTEYDKLQSKLGTSDMDMREGWQALIYRLQASIIDTLDDEQLCVGRFHMEAAYSGWEGILRAMSIRDSRHRTWNSSCRIRWPWTQIKEKPRDLVFGHSSLKHEGYRAHNIEGKKLIVSRLKNKQTNIGRGIPIAWPYVAMRRRTWDHLPMDVSKPIASTQLFDLAILAHRMGLVWKSFDPSGAGLEAESTSHALNSVELRGLGIGVFYRYSRQNYRSRLQEEVENRAPSKLIGPKAACWADSACTLLFGILSTNTDLLEPQLFFLNLRRDIIEIWEQRLQISDCDDWKAGFKEVGEGVPFRYLVNEMIALTAPFWRQAGNGVALLPFGAYFNSIFKSVKGRQTFAEKLKDDLESSSGSQGTSQMRKVSELAHQLLRDSTPLDGSFRDLCDLLDQVHEAFNGTTEYFKARQIVNPGLYLHIVRAHLSVSPAVGAEAMKGFPKQSFREPNVKCQTQQIHLMFDKMNHYISFMQDEGILDAVLVKEAWLTMMLRGFCWGLCHDVDGIQKDFLPAKYYGSQMPIYLV